MSTLHHFLNNVLKYERPTIDRRLLWGACLPPHTPCPLSSRSAGAPPLGRRSLNPPVRHESLAGALSVGRCGGLPP